MEELAKDIYIETGYEGVNVGAIITPTGVIGIDVPSYARDARDWAARIHRLSPYPVQYLILTDSHGDRILNTRWLNAPIIAQQAAADLLRNYEKKYPNHLLDSLSARNPLRARELSAGPVEHPTISFSGEMMLIKSGRHISLRHAPGPTAGHCWVLLPEVGLAFVGDTLVVGEHPMLRDANTAAWLTNLAWLAGQETYRRLAPGRGPLQDKATAIATLQRYLEWMRQHVGDYVQAHRSREDVGELVDELLLFFPNDPRPTEWLRLQMKINLGFVYDELKAA